MARQSLPMTMMGLQHTQSTGILKLEKSLPMPRIEADQYLIAVAATTITTGELLWPRPPELDTSCPGVEAAGTIVSGPLGGKFAISENVYFRTTYPRPGSAAQYSVAVEGELALCPGTIPLSDAAAVPVSALTAWQLLFEQSDLNLHIESPTSSNLKKRIFVNGASGGVGLFVVQLAQLANCEVVGTSTNEILVKSLGASEVINYKKTSISEWLEAHPQRFDMVIDLVGGDSLQQAWFAAKEGANVVTCVPPKDMQWKWTLDRPTGISKTINGKFFIMQPRGDHLQQITMLFNEGKLKASVDSVHPLIDFKKAFARLDSGRALGKVVIQVREQLTQKKSFRSWN